MDGDQSGEFVFEYWGLNFLVPRVTNINFLLQHQQIIKSKGYESY